MGEKKGLTSKGAKELLAKYGLNKLPEKGPPSSLRIFLLQFKSPLVYVLLFGTLVALELGEFSDALAIFLALFLNAFLGFYQEKKASRALASLKAILSPQAVVIRDGEQKKISVAEVVPGDLVVLHPGDKVPADGELVEAVDLTINEAILTGESMPVKKFKVQSSCLRRQAKFKATAQNSKLDNQANHLTIKPFNHDFFVFMGTTVVSGRGLFRATKTGVKTEMGKIAKSLEESQEPTPLQKQLGKLAKQLTVIIVLISLGLLSGGVLRNWSFSQTILTSLAVAVAAIPEGLLISLTVILALGMQTMAKKKGLVRKLVAAETLGGVTVICADKTGTLTEGEMRVAQAITSLNSQFPIPNSQKKLPPKYYIPYTKYQKDEEVSLFLKSAILCNNQADPLEMAMMNWAREKVKKGKRVEEEYPRIDEIPFDPKRKFMATLHRQNLSPITYHLSPTILFVHGAPEVVLAKSKIKNQKSKIWTKKIGEYGEQGYRLVGFAYKEIRDRGHGTRDKKYKIQNTRYKIQDTDIEGLTWQGLMLFEDPIRPGVAEALKECRSAGIKVKVITGDYPGTAVAVLNKLKIKNKQNLISGEIEKLKIFAGRSGRKDAEDTSDGVRMHSSEVEEVVTGSELDRVSDKQFQDRIEDIILFARTTPQQKLKIVKALKAKGEVVAMTGDGVNDAPALQAADIGIVVGEASDVAKETADLVLLDSNFATIVKAISVGRSIFENIKKVVLYLLSDSFTEVILIGGSLLLGLPLPLLPAQILWVNLVEDSLPSVALAFEGEEKDLMKRLPRSPQQGILDLKLKILIFIMGIATDLFLLGLFVFLVNKNYELGLLRTVMFLGLAINSLFYVFACRNLEKNLWQFNPFANRFLNFSVLLGLLFLVSAIYWPGLRFLLRTESLAWEWWLLVLGIGVFDLLAIEGGKWLFLNKRRFMIK